MQKTLEIIPIHDIGCLIINGEKNNIVLTDEEMQNIASYVDENYIIELTEKGKQTFNIENISIK